jgi:TRAP-type C4-dicarboxylate transport system permease small subunit
MVSDHLRGWLKTAARIFSGLVTLTFTFWFAYASLDWLGFAIELNLKTTNTGIPLVPWMVVMPLVMFLLAVAGLIALVKTVVYPHESVDQGLKGGD